MLKSEMEKMVKMAGGMMEAQEIKIEGQALKVGQTKSVSRQAIDSFAISNDTLEIIGFAAPQARGRIDKYDDGADVPSVIIKRNGNIHPASEYEIRIAWDW